MLSSLRPSSFRRENTSPKQQTQTEKQKQKTKKDRGEEAGLVHTAMSFEEEHGGGEGGSSSAVRSEWVLLNPGGREEKFEPWISFVQDAAAVPAAASTSTSLTSTSSRTRQPLNSYNMQRLPAESWPLKEGEAARCFLLASAAPTDPPQI